MTSKKTSKRRDEKPWWEKRVCRKCNRRLDDDEFVPYPVVKYVNLCHSCFNNRY
jgi:hypothetical protein